MIKWGSSSPELHAIRLIYSDLKKKMERKIEAMYELRKLIGTIREWHNVCKPHFENTHITGKEIQT